MYDPNYLKIIDEIQEEIIEEKHREKHKREVKEKIKSGLEYIVTNYNPIVGMLPANTQEKLKKRFKKINPLVASRATAVFYGLFAYFVGVHLQGFDIGFSVGDMDRIDSVRVFQPIYFSFIGGGFSKQTTDILSYYLMAETIPRIALTTYNRRPVGNLLLEAFDYLKNKVIFNRKYTVEAKKEIEDYLSKKKILDEILG